MPSAVLIGIDGGSWNFLDYLVSEGLMPNLKDMLVHGVHGTLKSVVPPVTGCAWLSLATGLNPGKTGVIDFLKRVNGLQLKPISSADYEGRSVWDYASYKRLRVGVLNYPFLYPPYPVNGFMVSGLGSPKREPSAWPPNLENDLEANDAVYPVYVDYHLPMYDDLDAFFKDIEFHMRKFMNALKLLANPKLNLFVVVVQASDWVLHRLWVYIDERHPMHNKLPREDVAKAKRWFGEFWGMVDDTIGIVLDKYSDNSVILIVSDHGFGPQYGVFNLAKWLVERGYMKIRRGIVKVKPVAHMRSIAISLGSKVVKKLPRVLADRIRRIGKEIVGYAAKNIESLVDVSNSIAICLGHTIPFGAIYLIDKSYVNKIVEDLRETLNELGIRASIWRREEIYNGDKLEMLPDIVFMIEDGRVVVLENLEELDRPLYVERPFSPRHTGSHRLEGIFVAYGQGIAKGKTIDNVSILDIAPTILHILGLAIPNNMDGRVLTKIFESSSVYAIREPRYVDPSYYAKLRLAMKIRGAYETVISRK